MTVKDLTSHDVRLGVRFTCCDDNTARRPVNFASPAPVYSQPLPQPQVLSMPQYAPPPPVYTQPQYAPPPPVYSQPQYAPQPQYQQPQYAPPQNYSQPPLNRRG